MIRFNIKFIQYNNKEGEKVAGKGKQSIRINERYIKRIFRGKGTSKYLF